MGKSVIPKEGLKPARLFINGHAGWILTLVASLLTVYITVPVPVDRDTPQFIQWLLSGQRTWWAFLALAVCAVSAALFPHVIQKPKYSQLYRSALKSHRKGESLEKVLKHSLRLLSDEVCYSSSEQRMTVYFVHGGRFHNLARYSANRKFEGRGRHTYPLDKGVIGSIWDFENDIVRLPLEDKDWYAETARTWKIPKKVSSRFSMKSRCIGGVHIKYGDEWVGLIVLESTTKTVMQKSHLKQVENASMFGLIVDLVGYAGSHFNRFDPAARPAPTVKTDALADWEDVKR